ncbi:MAG: rhodanese-like domain-containing protein [Gammaproteobacteria bacterium]|nr:rhodanese-like domain-containing protein [Gammaproteobacteria bacterium]
MKQYKFTQLLVLLVVFTSPLAVNAGKFPQVLMDTVASAKKATPVVTLDQFKAAIDDPAIWIVDVREPNEYAGGHVPSAINIPRGVIEFKIWKKVGYPDKTNMKQKMYLYCKAGSRCALATKSLRDLGFTEAYRTDIKLKEWAKAGNVLVK